MSRIPIRLRVTAVLAITMAAVLSGTGLFLYLRLGDHLSAALDRDLALRQQDLASLVQHTALSLATDTRGRFVETGESYAQLLDRQGHVVDATRPLGRVPVLDPAQVSAGLRHPAFVNVGPIPGLDEPSRILVTPVTRDGRRLALAVGTTTADRTETLARFRDELVIAGPVALLLASLAGYLLVGLSLRQVDAMRRRAASISAETPGERLPVPPTGDELERLGTTLNEMLDRLEEALERERKLVADAGHELRTPLARLRMELELALRQGRSPEELRGALQEAARETDRLSQLTAYLLLLARSDRGQLALELTRPSVPELLATVRSRFEWRLDPGGRRLEVEAAPELAVRGDRLRLEQALGNLVDNALRHGAGTVRLSARVNSNRVELHVTDEGAGIPAELLPRAFDRFVQGDRARGDGAGLGLSIAREIATAHDGALRAENTPSGCDVWLDLPPADAPP